MEKQVRMREVEVEPARAVSERNTRTCACCLGSFAPSTFTRAHAYKMAHSMVSTFTQLYQLPSSTSSSNSTQWASPRCIRRSIFNRMRQDRSFTDKQLQFKNAKSMVSMLTTYVDGMTLPQFQFTHAGSWHQCHGDSKSTCKGMLVTLCQLTVRNLPERHLATLTLARLRKSRSILLRSGIQSFR